jgi:hypothetical protein
MSVGGNGWADTDLGGQLEGLAVAHHLDTDLVAGLGACHLVHRAPAVAGRFTVDAENQIAWLQAGFLRRAIAIDASDDDAG